MFACSSWSAIRCRRKENGFSFVFRCKTKLPSCLHFTKLSEQASNLRHNGKSFANPCKVAQESHTYGPKTKWRWTSFKSHPEHRAIIIFIDLAQELIQIGLEIIRIIPEEHVVGTNQFDSMAAPSTCQRCLHLQCNLWQVSSPESDYTNKHEHPWIQPPFNKNLKRTTFSLGQPFRRATTTTTGFEDMTGWLLKFVWKSRKGHSPTDSLGWRDSVQSKFNAAHVSSTTPTLNYRLNMDMCFNYDDYHRLHCHFGKCKSHGWSWKSSFPQLPDGFCLSFPSEWLRKKARFPSQGHKDCKKMPSARWPFAVCLDSKGSQG